MHMDFLGVIMARLKRLEGESLGTGLKEMHTVAEYLKRGEYGRSFLHSGWPSLVNRMHH